MRGVILLAICIAVSGCTVRLHGHQSTSGGVTTTTTSSAVSGSVKTGNAKLAVSSGRPVSPRAQGGHLKLSGDAAVALLLGLILIDTVHYITAYFSPPPATSQRHRDSVADTCSCYGYQGGTAQQ
jgi:hypothetical protein